MSRGVDVEIAEIIESLMVLVIIFALIFAASEQWGTFAFLIMIGSLMIFITNFARVNWK